MVDTSRASRKRKHRLSWRHILSPRLRKSSTHQGHMSQSPASSNRTSLTLSVDTHRPSHTLVRSNARAKSPRNLQAPKTVGINTRPAKSNGADNPNDNDSPSPCLRDGSVRMDPDTKNCLPSPPPYLLSLPDAVVTPPSLVALANDELRSRGIYSPHPTVDQSVLHDSFGIFRSTLSRNPSFRSAFSLIVPRLGLRPADASGGVYPRPEDHLSSLLSSALLTIGICISMLMISIDRGTITTAIPSIMTDFESFEEMGWYGSAYLMTAAAFQPMYGRVYTSFNIKWSFLVAVIIFQAGALICAVAPTSEVFTFGRAVQGLGNAGISTGSFAIANQGFSTEWKPVVLTFLDVLFWAGTVAGPVLGAIFSQLLSWQWCYYLNLILAGTTFVCVLLFFRPHRPRTSRPSIIRQASDFSSTGKSFARRIMALDWIGSVLLMLACTFLFVTLQTAQEKGFDWSSLPWIVFASLSVTTTLLCVLWMHLRGDNALIPFHVVRQRTVAVSCGAAFFLCGAFTVQIYYLPFWFKVIKNQDTIDSGISMIPYMLTMSILSLAASRYVFRKGHFAPCTILGCGIAFVGAGLMTMLDPETSMFMWVGFQVMMAAGLGIAMQKSLSAVQAVLSPHEVPIATAAIIAYQNLGGAIFVSAGSALFQRYLLNNGTIPEIDLRVIMKLDMAELATLIPEESYSAVLEVYDHALRAVFVGVIPLCGVAFLLSMFMERNIMHNDLDARTPGSVGFQGINRGLTSPELGSDAPTLAHLAPRARQRWSRGWSRPIMDVEAGRTRMTTVMQELNESQTSLYSLGDTMDAEIKAMEIGIAR